jgi:hypothetical protein
MLAMGYVLIMMTLTYGSLVKRRKRTARSGHSIENRESE